MDDQQDTKTTYPVSHYPKQQPEPDPLVEEIRRLTSTLETPQRFEWGTSDYAVSWNTAIFGVAMCLALSYFGILGPPLGPDSTHAGALSPLVCIMLGALNFPAPVFRVFKRMVGAVAVAAAQQAVPR